MNWLFSLAEIFPSLPSQVILIQSLFWFLCAAENNTGSHDLGESICFLNYVFSPWTIFTHYFNYVGTNCCFVKQLGWSIRQNIIHWLTGKAVYYMLCLSWYCTGGLNSDFKPLDLSSHEPLFLRNLRTKKTWC